MRHDHPGHDPDPKKMPWYVFPRGKVSPMKAGRPLPQCEASELLQVDRSHSARFPNSSELMCCGKQKLDLMKL